jgi:hypothetical protein
MTQEDKNLLFKDLCARLPYEIRCSYYDICLSAHCNGEVYGIENKEYAIVDGRCIAIEFIKPYLFPLSSMTEEQFVDLKVFADLTYEGNTLELIEWNDNCKTLEFWLEEIPSYCVIKVFDWLNKNHFDYRGLIEKDLALDATELKIY